MRQTPYCAVLPSLIGAKTETLIIFFKRIPDFTENLLDE
jgi:hypothetical protein